MQQAFYKNWKSFVLIIENFGIPFQKFREIHALDKESSLKLTEKKKYIEKENVRTLFIDWVVTLMTDKHMLSGLLYVFRNNDFRLDISHGFIDERNIYLFTIWINSCYHNHIEWFLCFQDQNIFFQLKILTNFRMLFSPIFPQKLLLIFTFVHVWTFISFRFIVKLFFIFLSISLIISHVILSTRALNFKYLSLQLKNKRKWDFVSFFLSFYFHSSENIGINIHRWLQNYEQEFLFFGSFVIWTLMIFLCI